ncbi:hypothetical protein MPV89_004188 [Vibrio vulnificus]|uniref:hypothetical protein n=1 Tax=Vibrio vulnificus TaxID=672 RepID=UPI0005F20FE9|nr:hypothetical protein [Vibrio vulnificus]EHH2451463.1 hypothetical protein [Vibrio vulnificus]EIZ4669975.1 hypothetical protein [Vibrio vulnificus]HDY7694765.1 hypothetical protein [Vibrio vulnificus]HDY7809346.1 hypothetical protein [Vibrio vulnificus]
MFRSKIKVGLVVVALSFLNACASGSAIVTGVKRPALDFNQVRLYLEAPEQYETIGIVKASSDAGITQQASQDYAVEELKKQAAKIGANGVILTTTGERTSSIISTNADGSIYTIPVSAQTVSGKAVFVKE